MENLEDSQQRHQPTAINKQPLKYTTKYSLYYTNFAILSEILPITQKKRITMTSGESKFLINAILHPGEK